MSDSAEHVIGKRYILRAPLGEGGMGRVYRAYDRLTGQVVALKRVSEAPAAADATTGSFQDYRLALAQEFRILASLRHPHIISVLDYGFDSSRQPYYTMELLENACTILDAGRDQPLLTKIGLLQQMLQALAYLHRRGITHRDLKPSNVLVAEGTVKVLDFGLSVSAGQSDAARSTAGTLAYMAPEVLMGGSASERADLYAVGMMAYELFAGRHPFNIAEPARLINSILYDTPDSTDLDVEPRLALVIGRLLAKTPDSRYASAEMALRELRAATDQALPLETAATRESYLQAARLVGRDAEMARLSAALTDAIAGKGSAWLVAGESGVGKSRLLEELRALALVRGALVLRGQAVPEIGSPYSLWRPVLRWLALLVELEEAQWAVLKTLVPDLDALIGRALPDAPDDTSPARLIAAVEAAFRQYDGPMVIFLEDLHWAEESLDVLARLAEIAPELPLLLIGSYRDDERPEVPSRLPIMHMLRLERLSPSAIAELSEAMLGDNGRQPQVLDLLQRETEGNVFFLVEVVRALAEEAGTLDRIGLVTLPVHVFMGGMRQIVQRRLDRLPPSTRPLLTMAAIIGREIDLRLMQAVAPEEDIALWLSLCADAAVVDVLDGQWRFAHDKLRDGVLADLSESDRRALHAQAAAAYEQVYGDSGEFLAAAAYHFGKAGDRAKEERYAALAGRQALLSGAYREALVWFERALLLVTEALYAAAAAETMSTGQAVMQTALRMREVNLKKQIAVARLGLGQYASARQLYQDNLVTCQQIKDQQGQADALRSLGDVAYALAEYAEAQIYYQQALALYQELENGDGITRTLNNLGNVAYDVGEEAQAKQLYQKSLSRSREAGSGWGMAGAIAAPNLATSTLPVVSDSDSEAPPPQRLQAALERYLADHDRRALAASLQRVLAGADHAEIAPLLAAAADRLRQAGDTGAAALVQMHLGLLDAAANHLPAAELHLREALHAARSLPDMPLALAVIAAAGRLFIQRGDKETAIELLALALHHPDSPEPLQDEAERLLFELQAGLPPEQAHAAWERGKTRRFEDAAALLDDKANTQSATGV